MGKPDALSRRSDHRSGMDDNQNLALLTPNLFAIRALEGRQVVGEEKDILKEIRLGMESEDQEEVVIMAIKELKKYVPGAELHCWILTLCHDSKLAGHPGRWKTLELVSRNYWWPQMSSM